MKHVEIFKISFVISIYTLLIYQLLENNFMFTYHMYDLSFFLQSLGPQGRLWYNENEEVAAGEGGGGAGPGRLPAGAGQRE